MKSMSACVALACGAMLIAGANAQPVVTDPVAALVSRLDLARYKATIKGLTQFGDRRQGTSRNRQAVDWIEAQLRSYGCTNTERITYTYAPEPRPAVRPPAPRDVTVRRPPGGGTFRGVIT